MSNWYCEFNPRFSSYKFQMGQKINANSLRLGKRSNWKSEWFDDKNYCLTFWKDTEIRKTLKSIVKFFGYSLNNFYIKKSNKKFHIFNKLISSSELLSFIKNIRLKKPSAYKSLMLQKIKNNNICKITPFSNETILDIRRHSSLIKISSFDKSSLTILPFISSQALSDYLGLQLISPPKIKDDCFKRNFWQGLTLFLYSFFNKKTVFQINGFKLICSGRWKKSKTGRKQKFFCSIGKLRSQTYSTFIDYGFTNVNTKYGVCCIKVWISYKQS